MTGVVPLFATLSTGTKPFGEALPATATTSAPSPWSPKIEAPAIDEAAQRAALDKAKREAVEQGRAAGMAETDALRAKLKQLIGELEQSRDVRAERYAEAIADAAVTAIEAWIGTMFVPGGHPADKQWQYNAGGFKVSQVVIFGTYNEVVASPGIPLP